MKKMIIAIAAMMLLVSVLAYAGDMAVTGKLGVGTTAPDGSVHISASSGTVTMDEDTVAPGAPTASNQCRIYMKADKLVIQYNQAGTVRYKYLTLSGTGVTWVHTTTAP